MSRMAAGSCADIERLLGAVGVDQIVGALVERVHGAHAGVRERVLELLVHALQEQLAAGEARRVHVRGQVDVVNAVVAGGRVRHVEGVVAAPDEAGLAGARPTSGIATYGGRLFFGPSSFATTDAVAGIFERGQRLVAGQQVLAGLLVGGDVGGERPHQGDLVHHLRRVRQVLAELDAGDVRPDGAELAADLARRIRLRVERVQMAGPARQPEQDDRIPRVCPSPAAAALRIAKNCGSESPKNESAPTFSRSRRLTPSQFRRRCGSRITVFMRSPPGRDEARRHEVTKTEVC